MNFNAYQKALFWLSMEIVKTIENPIKHDVKVCDALFFFNRTLLILSHIWWRQSSTMKDFTILRYQVTDWFSWVRDLNFIVFHDIPSLFHFHPLDKQQVSYHIRVTNIAFCNMKFITQRPFNYYLIFQIRKKKKKKKEDEISQTSSILRKRQQSKNIKLSINCVERLLETNTLVEYLLDFDPFVPSQEPKHIHIYDSLWISFFILMFFTVGDFFSSCFARTFIFVANVRFFLSCGNGT